MRKILVLIAVSMALPAMAADVPIEPDAVMSNNISTSLISPAVDMIRAYGWKCDSISALRPFLMSRGFTVVCNNFSYTYNLEDKGGNWVVSLD